MVGPRSLSLSLSRVVVAESTYLYNGHEGEFSADDALASIQGAVYGATNLTVPAATLATWAEDTYVFGVRAFRGARNASTSVNIELQASVLFLILYICARRFFFVSIWPHAWWWVQCLFLFGCGGVKTCVSSCVFFVGLPRRRSAVCVALCFVVVCCLPLQAGNPPQVSIGALTSAKYNPNNGAYLALEGKVVRGSKPITTQGWTKLVGDDPSEDGVSIWAVDDVSAETQVLNLGALTAGQTYTFEVGSSNDVARKDWGLNHCD